MEGVKKRKYERGFTMVSNVFLKDVRLSWKAKGLITYVVHLPDDWVLNLKDLQNRATDGRDSLYSGIKELIKYGYCKRIIQRFPDGTIKGYQYEIDDHPFTENPEADPLPENPETVKPEAGKPETGNPPIINTNSTNNEKSKAPGNAVAGSLFPDDDLAEKKKKKTLFVHSLYGKFEDFEKKFSGRDFEKIDILHYFNAVSRWSDKADVKRTARGWIATAKDFMARDNEKNKLRLKPEFQNQAQVLNISEALEYLNDDL